MRRPAEWLACLGCLVLGVLIPAYTARAASGYPDYGNTRVNDFAHLLTPADAAQLRDMSDELRRSRGIEAVVVTIGSIKDYPAGAAQSFEQFATGLFNSWGIGDRNRNDGVLILVAVRDRKVRVELGSGYPGDMDARISHLIQTEFVPAFKRGDYRGGILQGSRAVCTEVGLWRERGAASGPSGQEASVPRVSSGAGAPAIPSSPPVPGGNHYHGNLPPVPFHTSSPVYRSSGSGFGEVVPFLFFAVVIVIVFSVIAKGISIGLRQPGARDQRLNPNASDDTSDMTNTFIISSMLDSSGSSNSFDSSSSSSSFDSSSSSGGDCGGGSSSGGGSTGSW